MKHGVSTIDSHYRIFVDHGSEVWRNLRIEVHSHESGVLQCEEIIRYKGLVGTNRNNIGD